MTSLASIISPIIKIAIITFAVTISKSSESITRSNASRRIILGVAFIRSCRIALFKLNNLIKPRIVTLKALVVSR